MRLDLHVVVVELEDGTFNAYANAPWRALQHAICRKGNTADEAVSTLRVAIEEEASMNGVVSVLTTRETHTKEESPRSWEDWAKDALFHDAASIGGQLPWSSARDENACLMRRCIELADALAPFAAIADSYDVGDLEEAKPEGGEFGERILEQAETPLYCTASGKTLIRLSDVHRAHNAYHPQRRYAASTEVQRRNALKAIRSCLTMEKPVVALVTISQIIKDLGEL